MNITVNPVISQQEKCEGLYQAVLNRDVQQTEKYLSVGARPDYISNDLNLGHSPFHAALPTYEGRGENDEPETETHIKLLNLLIKSRYFPDVNPFTEDSNGYNPFEWAIADGKPRCVEWFIDLLEKDPWKEQASSIINRQNNLPSALPNRNCKRIQGQIPLHIAVVSESLKTVQALYQFTTPRPSASIQNVDGDNAIHLAIHRNLPEILLEIVTHSKRSELTITNNKRQDALQHAECVYKEGLQSAITPKHLLRAFQCVEVLKARLYVLCSMNYEF